MCVCVCVGVGGCALVHVCECITHVIIPRKLPETLYLYCMGYLLSFLPNDLNYCGHWEITMHIFAKRIFAKHNNIILYHLK